MSIGIRASGKLNSITVVRRGSGTPASNGSTWATLTSAVDGTPPANPATYAVFTNAVSGGTGYIEVAGYDFSSIPAGATITSCIATARHLVNNASRWASGTLQAYLATTATGTAKTLTLPTTVTNESTVSIPVTVAQLQGGTFKMRFSCVHAANTQSGTWSIDHIDVTVVYAP